MIRIARDLAVAAHRDIDCYYQLCALVVKKNRVLSVGYNNPKTHPRASRTKMKQLHAEIDAIIRCDDPMGAELIVVRARRDHMIGMAKPCVACEAMIRQVGIKKVYYTTYCPDWNFPLVEFMDFRNN